MPGIRFQRTTLTWLSYGLLAFHTFLQAMISASARATFAAGLAIMTAPLFLGSLADNVGIQSAYGAVLALLILGMIVGRLAGWKVKPG